MIQHPGIPTFEFIVLSSLRAAQLMRGCTPRVDASHKRMVIAQLEVAAGEIQRSPDPAAEKVLR
jgi:DNA-directed RNA polymerase subunit K/omega